MVLQVRYQASQPALPVDLPCNKFKEVGAVLGGGAQAGCLEQVLLNRSIKGPGWLLLQAPEFVNPYDQVGLLYGWLSSVGMERSQVCCLLGGGGSQARWIKQLHNFSLSWLRGEAPRGGGMEYVARSIEETAKIVEQQGPG